MNRKKKPSGEGEEIKEKLGTRVFAEANTARLFPSGKSAGAEPLHGLSMDERGFEPLASSLRTTRSTAELHALKREYYITSKTFIKHTQDIII